jgi:hypothetical protein
MPLTITMELRVDYDTANRKIKEPVIIQRAKELAAELLTIAELTADTRKPSISLQCGDMFCTTEELRIVDASTEGT